MRIWKCGFGYIEYADLECGFGMRIWNAQLECGFEMRISLNFGFFRAVTRGHARSRAVTHGHAVIFHT